MEKPKMPFWEYFLIALIYGAVVGVIWRVSGFEAAVLFILIFIAALLTVQFRS